MDTFKPGDKVRRIKSEIEGYWEERMVYNGFKPDGVFTVLSCKDFDLYLVEIGGSYSASYFDLVSKGKHPRIPTKFAAFQRRVENEHVQGR